MMGKRLQREPRLFHVGFDLETRVPAGHVLRKIDQVVDFNFIRPMVAGLYGYNGQVSVDPALVLRLLFLCFFENIRSERELMRLLPLRLDWLWFCGMDLDSPIPDHSVLSKARCRWGERTFERAFAHVLGLCQDAGLVHGQTVHADSTLLKASASLEGRVSRVLWQQLEDATRQADAVCAQQDQEQQTLPGQRRQQDDRGEAVQASGQDHAGQDHVDHNPVDQGHDDLPMPAVEEPEPADREKTSEQVKPTEPVKRSGRVKLNDRLVSPVDPDAATSTRNKGGTTLGYRDHRLIDDHRGIILATVATAADTDDGSMLGELLSRQVDYTNTQPDQAVGDSMYGTIQNYAMLKREGIKAYLKKRRGKDSPKVSWLAQLPTECSRTRALELLARRKSRAEGSFAEAHVRMNHRRCRWRRRWNVQIQCYLVGMVQNVKKLARAGHARVGSVVDDVLNVRRGIYNLLLQAMRPELC